MKKFLLLLTAAFVILAIPACQKPKGSPSGPESGESPLSESAGESLPDPSTPEGAVAELLHGAKEWDIPAVDAHLPDGTSISGRVPPALEDTLSAILQRMEYRVGRSTVTGDAATVDVDITTVDAEGTVNEAVGKAVGTIAKRQLAGQPVDDYAAVIEEVLASIDISSLPTTTIAATAHMVMGGDGEWKLDLSDEKNLPLFNAMTGGAMDLADRLKEMAETYDIPLAGLSR